MAAALWVLPAIEMILGFLAKLLIAAVETLSLWLSDDLAFLMLCKTIVIANTVEPREKKRGLYF